MGDYHETGEDIPNPADLPVVEPLWRREPRRDSKGNAIPCGHLGCHRNAVRIVSYEAPKHREFFGQTHECCSVHSRPTRPKET